MGFVDKEKARAVHAVGKESGKSYIRVKGIVVITDYKVHPVRGVKAQLERTYHMLICIGKNDIPVHDLFMYYHVKDRIVYSVKMPLCVRTFFAVTFHLLQGAELFLGCKIYIRGIKAASCKYPHGLPCHGSCYRFCGKIKYLIGITLAHGLKCGIHSRNGLAYACGCLDIKVLFFSQKAVCRAGKSLLSRPVFKRKCYFFY